MKDPRELLFCETGTFDRKVNYDQAIDAMQIYAQQMAVEFAKWICDSPPKEENSPYFNRFTLIDNNWYYAEDLDGDNQLIEEDLFQMFIDEKIENKP
jgi:hypothetical protein